MTLVLLLAFRRGELPYDEIVIVFANTGQENEETLIFVEKCSRLLFEPLGFKVVWIEAVQHHGLRKSSGFKVVDFDTADRTGSVFEDMIRKYGIPNKVYTHCTRSLKRRPIEAYAKSLGWARKSYDTAIGIRADEIDRMAEGANANGIVYPLVRMGATKPAINKWWAKQPFRLRLKGYQGNCRWCWKKSLRKHMTLLGEDRTAYEFPRRMEALYGHIGPEFLHDPAKRRKPLPEGYRRVFFREGRSTEDLLKMHAELPPTFVPARDDALPLDQPDLFDVELDTGGGCGESCEVWADD